MQIQVREQVLDIWRSVIAQSYRDGKWTWGGRSGSNSISDAEQLLCVLYPATNIPGFRFDRPDETASDIRNALRGLGSEMDAPRIFIDLLLEYVERYRAADGAPSFACGGYLNSSATGPPTQQQLDLELVDSYSMSVTLMLACLGFVRVLKETARGVTLLRKMEALEALASERLTAAMIGLLRSFSVTVFDLDSVPGQNLIAMINQTLEPSRIVGERLSRSLSDIRASLKEELSIGSGQVAEELDTPGRLFQCGWSWGVVADAPHVAYGKSSGGQGPGVAEDRPYLYFTVVAMDGIEDLFSERTRILGLLDEDQQRLAQALQLRWDLCLQYWTRIALFGGGRRWPIEDLPWRTADGIENDYFSLLLTSMVVQRFSGREGSSESDLLRIGTVLDELAQRGRITRRPVGSDEALQVHVPGLRLSLRGSEVLGPLQGWLVTCYSSMLLKRVVTMMGMIGDTAIREWMTTLGNDIWAHLLQRRIAQVPTEDLWDDPSGIFPLPRNPGLQPSWYQTERVVECLVNAAIVVKRPPRVSASLAQVATEYLAEAEHLFDQEKLNGMADAGLTVRRSFQTIAASIDRARVLALERPGTASIIAQDILRELEALAVARQGFDPNQVV